MTKNVLHDITDRGFRLRIIERKVGEHLIPFVEVSRPERCECVKEFNLSTIVVALLSLTEDKFWELASRDWDAEGHLQCEYVLPVNLVVGHSEAVNIQYAD